MERQFLDRGLGRAKTARDAEIVVLNTCTVTEGADKDARASIRRLQRENPGCRILVTGCYAQRAPEELAQMPGVTWVVGNSHKHQVAEIASAKSTFVPLSDLSGKNEANVVVGDIFAHTELLAAPVFEAANERTRPNLKVQDGCDNRCSFCVIPSVRGQSRSLPMERVIAEVRTLVEAGYREVVISGINLGRWGRDLDSGSQLSALSSQERVVGRSSLVVRDSLSRRQLAHETESLHRERLATKDQRLVDLVRAILDRTSLEKLRISSVEPMDWSDELIRLVANSPRIAKHAHVPMQSGSDAVLRRMHRKYRPWHYQEKIQKIRAAMPRAAIGADVMVGFPGETESEFEETRRMVDELPFTYLHVFTYSRRPGTPAAENAGQVPVAIARERNRILREIAVEKQAAFRQSQVGTTVEAITLQTGTEISTDALTHNYLKVQVRGKLEPNRWVKVVVQGVEGAALIGEVPVGTAGRNSERTEVTSPSTRKSINIVDLPRFTGYDEQNCNPTGVR